MRLAPALLALLIVQAAPARADDPQPFETVRALQALQDRIAAGDKVSQTTHARAILRTARAFAKVKPEAWAEKRNARALILYLFSGGDAKAIADAIPVRALAPEVQDMYAGALAYGAGDDVTARDKLMPIEARGQPGGIGGHLALVQATLAAAKDPAKAIALLDLARLLEPGTLVEEAALRKEMSLIDATGDLDKFALLTRRYLGAFPRSSYAENFRQLVARRATQIGADDSAEAGARLARLMAGLEPTERRKLYLAIAHAAVVAGRTSIATLAGDAARGLATPGDADAARATLYADAAAIVGDRYDVALRELAAVAPDRLSEGDRALRISALAVAEIIRQPAPAQAADAQGAQAAVAADAERALADADAALKSTTQ